MINEMNLIAMSEGLKSVDAQDPEIAFVINTLVALILDYKRMLDVVNKLEDTKLKYKILGMKLDS